MKILKVLLTAWTILIASQLSIAQVKVEFGLKVGLNYSTIDNHYGSGGISWVEKYSTFFKYHFGGYVLIKASRFAFQPEVIYSQQGQNFSYYNKGNSSIEINYINIPLILKYYLIEGLSVQAGPQIGFLTEASGDVLNTLTGEVKNQSIAGLVKSLDFSIALGAGWDLPNGLSFTARYNFGLTDISKYSGGMMPSGIIPNGGTVPIGTDEAKNRVIQLSVGYKISKKGHQ